VIHVSAINVSVVVFAWQHVHEITNKVIMLHAISQLNSIFWVVGRSKLSIHRLKMKFLRK
jgi:hypothetical protein